MKLLWNFEPARRWLATTHVAFSWRHFTFFKNFPSHTTSNNQTTTKDFKGVLLIEFFCNTSNAQKFPVKNARLPFLRAHIYLYIALALNKNWLPYVSCPPETLVEDRRHSYSQWMKVQVNNRSELPIYGGDGITLFLMFICIIKFIGWITAARTGLMLHL